MTVKQKNKNTIGSAPKSEVNQNVNDSSTPKKVEISPLPATSNTNGSISK